MLIDAHTHSASKGVDLSIINCYPSEVQLNDSYVYSCGIHPWYIKPEKTEEWISGIDSLCKNNNIVAIGECGLDKNIDDLEYQKEVFKTQIRLSEQYKLPCIIHSVKTHHLILEIKKETRAQMPWLVHGFSGSIETAQQFASQNIFISFGENLIKHPDKFKKLLNQVDMDFVLFETDDSDVTIQEVYREAAKLLNKDLAWLENKIEMNFNRFLGK
ncbi:TatD family hydrolase [Labilibacter marinus]|uniref:TatD family hydrolase n=1 Tax=Labilibacter marinus TaxID=1477105 RepID=UPI00082B7C5F|nr:TatD family hydrolase [Labilibacter marinus]